MAIITASVWVDQDGEISLPHNPREIAGGVYIVPITMCAIKVVKGQQ